VSINLINPGLVPNDGTGDPLRVGAIKVNENIAELYSILNASVVPPQTNNTGKLLSTNGTSLLWVESFAATNPQADWLAISGPSQILNKPLLSLVATSGNYLDLINRPIVPSNTNQLINGADFAVRSEITWNSLLGKPNFALVATTGDYLDLINRPTSDIPSQSGNSGRYLTTNGSVLSWATVVGGSGEGTSINTSRTEFTATAGQTVFTGVGTYEIGAGQLRVYIDGVRQFPTAYTETTTTSFTLNAGIAVGTAVLAEVDGYVSAPAGLPSQTGNDGKFLTTDGTLVSWATIPSVYVLPTATTSILGGVKVDGTSITINGNGVISSVGGGGSGTIINTSRTVFATTAGQTVFTGVGAYTIGAGQLRVYLDGVRQFPNAYTETSTTSFTLTTGVAVGTAVLAEVDGYTGTPELYTLPIATTTILGGVKVDGTTITINPSTGVISSVGGGGSGTIINTSRTEFTATDGQTVFTGVGPYEIGTGQLRVYIAGVRQFPTAYTETTTTSFTLNTGIVRVGTLVLAEVDGYTGTPELYTLPTATTSILGGVKVDGTSITINGNGVISSIGGGGSVDLTNISTDIIPSNTDSYNLGTPSLAFQNLYLTGSLFIGQQEINFIDENGITTLNLPSGTTIDGVNIVPVSITNIIYPYSGAAVSTAGGETVIIQGTGFRQFSAVTINGLPANGTSFVNTTEVQFVTIPQDAGPAILSIINIDGSTATYTFGLLYVIDGYPRFTQSSGQLGVFIKDEAVSISLGITGGTGPYSFSIPSGNLPPGLNIDSQTGVISGIAPDIEYETVYNFSIRVTDSNDPSRSTTSNFYIVIAVVSSANFARLTFSINSNYTTAVFGNSSKTLDFSVDSNYLTYIKALGSKTLDFSVASDNP